MDKQCYIKGFTLVECVVVLALLSILQLLTLPYVYKKKSDFYIFKNDYLKVQSEAMATREKRKMEIDVDGIIPYPIQFNAKGNVNRAQTCLFDDKKVVIMIAGGRLVDKE